MISTCTHTHMQLEQETLAEAEARDRIEKFIGINKFLHVLIIIIIFIRD